MRILVVAVLCLLAHACQCGEDGGGPGPVPTIRCEADLRATGLFAQVGTSARAAVLGAGDPLIGGQLAEARVGDVLLENDRIRVVIGQPGRDFGPVPFGGWIVDADLTRAPGEAGRDQFGRMGLLYAFGRTINATDVEILSDGASGGPAIVAVTGADALNDFVHLQAVIGRYISGAALAIDPEPARPIKATTYYVLSPGESRVRVYTQFCNEGPELISLPLGELIDQGGSTEFFNPEGCAGSLGSAGCSTQLPIEPTLGFAFQGDGVAYGYRSYRPDNSSLPSPDALLRVGGTVGVLIGAENMNGVLTWLDLQAPRRPGTFAIKAGERRAFLRDFFVGRDLADITSTLLTLDEAQRGRLSARVEYADGAAAPGARVAIRGSGNRLVTILVAGPDGRARADLPPGTYAAQAGIHGHALEPPASVPIGTQGTTERTFVLGPSRVLTVTVRDPFGAAMPAKVTVLCRGGTCPTPAAKYGELFEMEAFPTNVASVGFVPPHGTLAMKLAPGEYEVVVTRGPEFSAFPDTWPAQAAAVDLTSTDQTFNATLARVVDTQGWIGADLHVHAMNSADSSVANDVRVMSFLAEGVDLLVSTDHDVLTDYAPSIAALGAQDFIATVVGSELSTFDYGHFNAFPLVRRQELHGGPFDWAGGADGATLRATELFAGVRQAHPSAVLQLNHARGQTGVLTLLRVDTDTFASHADPLQMRMSPAPDATATDTRLFDANFDAIEIANGLVASTPLLNDWMTMLSSGRRKVATGVSDTHHAFSTLGGYSRTYVDVGVADAPASFDASAFASGLKALRAIGTNGPFIRLSARRLAGGTTPSGDPVPIGGTVSIAPGDAVELTVDVQAPEWVRFDRLELYTHADGREALDGQGNTADPAIHEVRSLNPSTLPLEAVPGMNGQQFRRVHVVEVFRVTPPADTWYAVILRSGAGATLYPLAYDSVTCDPVCTANAARPFAFTNPIFVDADGSGAYDTFPQKVQRSVRAPLESTTRSPPGAPTLEELGSALRHALEHHQH